MTGTAHRAPVAALATSLLTTAVVALVLAAMTPATLRAALAPNADPGVLLAALAAGAGWLLVTRLLLGLTAALVAVALRGTTGLARRVAVRCAEALTPALLHGLLRAALGAVVVGAPTVALTPSVALADPGAPAVPVLDRVPGVLTPASAPATRIVVRPGDSLWRIADAHLPSGHTPADVAAAWPAWYAANRATIGLDPGLIRPGQVLTAPTGRGGRP